MAESNISQAQLQAAHDKINDFYQMDVDDPRKDEAGMRQLYADLAAILEAQFLGVGMKAGNIHFMFKKDGKTVALSVQVHTVN